VFEIIGLIPICLNLSIFMLTTGVVLLLSISLNCVLVQNAFILRDISSPFHSFIAPAMSLKQTQYALNLESNLFLVTIL
jgi:hypothetical protein